MVFISDVMSDCTIQETVIPDLVSIVSGKFR